MPSPIPGPPPFATSSLSGLVSTTTQTFAGDKTFLGKLSMSGNALLAAGFTTGGRPAFGANIGGVIYNTDLSQLQFSDGTDWITLATASGSFVQTTGDTMTGDLTITGAGLFADSGFNTLVVDPTTHRVGIKIGSPTVELDVSGAARITSTLDLYSALANTKLRLFNDGGGNVAGFGYQTNDFRAHLNSSSDKFSWHASAAGASLMELLGGGNFTVDGGDNTFIVDAVNNRVGIGTPSPANPLTVVGIIQSTSGGFRFPDASTQTSAFVPSSYVQRIGDSMSGTLTITGAAANLDVDSADHTLFVDATNNRVGIGRNDPPRSFSIKESVSADHLVEIWNSNVAGSSGIAYMDNAGVERFRMGYASPSWAGAPLADLCFLQTDSNKDLIIAHAGTLAHRFFATGNVKFDPTDNTLFVDAVNNRVAMGTGSPSSNHFVDIDQSLAAKKLVRIHNPETTGFSAIEFFNSTGTAIGSIGMSGTAATPANAWGIDSGTSTFVLRNGATTYHSFANQGNVILDVADNTFWLDAVNNKIAFFAGTVPATTAGFTTTWIADVTGANNTLVIKGDGTHRKGLSILDSTNTRTWTWDHATSTNNNRFELWYHNGTTENRVLTMTTGGRLGINNVTPTVELDVSGDAQISGGLTVDTNTLVVDATANSVGIGTTPAAGSQLHVAGNARVDGFLKYSTTDSITAHAGGGQGSAVALTTDTNFITVVASAGDSVKLPTGVVGYRITVFNLGANAADVFPASGGAIDALGTDTAFSLGVGVSKTFFAQTTTQWRSV